MPERILLIHIQTTRDAYGHTAVPTLGTVEQQMQFLGVGIAALHVVAAAVREMALAFVAREVAVAVGKTVPRNHTLVFASVALYRLRCVRSRIDKIFQRRTLDSSVAGIKSASERTHQFGTFAAEDLAVGQTFEGAHYGIVSHCTALNHNAISKLIRTAELENLIEAVLYHRV